MKLVIYMFTNKINGKIYIGKTKGRLCNRVANHRYNSKKMMPPMPIGRAISKYGFENFEVTVLEECSTEEELNCRESFWIKEKNATDSSVGYNILSECQDHSFMANDDYRDKCRVSRQGQKAGNSLYSKYIGCRLWAKQWYCQISINGKMHSKRCLDESDAAGLYDRLALAHYGQGAKLNFEEKREEYLRLDLKLTLEEFLTKPKTSSYLGVAFDKTRNKWVAAYRAGGKRVLFKRFKTEQEAVFCYNEFIRLNYPNEIKE
jgi:group I intron endonuclease